MRNDVDKTNSVMDGLKIAMNDFLTKFREIERAMATLDRNRSTER